MEKNNRSNNNEVAESSATTTDSLYNYIAQNPRNRYYGFRRYHTSGTNTTKTYGKTFVAPVSIIRKIQKGFNRKVKQLSSFKNKSKRKARQKSMNGIHSNFSDGDGDGDGEDIDGNDDVDYEEEEEQLGEEERQNENENNFQKEYYYTIEIDNDMNKLHHVVALSEKAFHQGNNVEIDSSSVSLFPVLSIVGIAEKDTIKEYEQQKMMMESTTSNNDNDNDNKDGEDDETSLRYSHDFLLEGRGEYYYDEEKKEEDQASTTVVTVESDSVFGKGESYKEENTIIEDKEYRQSLQQQDHNDDMNGVKKEEGGREMRRTSNNLPNSTTNPSHGEEPVFLKILTSCEELGLSLQNCHPVTTTVSLSSTAAAAAAAASKENQKKQEPQKLFWSTIDDNDETSVAAENLVMKTFLTNYNNDNNLVAHVICGTDTQSTESSSIPENQIVAATAKETFPVTDDSNECKKEGVPDDLQKKQWHRIYLQHSIQRIMEDHKDEESTNVHEKEEVDEDFKDVCTIENKEMVTHQKMNADIDLKCSGVDNGDEENPQPSKNTNNLYSFKFESFEEDNKKDVQDENLNISNDESTFEYYNADDFDFSVNFSVNFPEQETENLMNEDKNNKEATTSKPKDLDKFLLTERRPFDETSNTSKEEDKIDNATFSSDIVRDLEDLVDVRRKVTDGVTPEETMDASSKFSAFGINPFAEQTTPVSEFRNLESNQGTTTISVKGGKSEFSTCDSSSRPLVHEYIPLNEQQSEQHGEATLDTNIDQAVERVGETTFLAHGELGQNTVTSVTKMSQSHDVSDSANEIAEILAPTKEKTLSEKLGDLTIATSDDSSADVDKPFDEITTIDTATSVDQNIAKYWTRDANSLSTSSFNTFDLSITKNPQDVLYTCGGIGISKVVMEKVEKYIDSFSYDAYSEHSDYDSFEEDGTWGEENDSVGEDTYQRLVNDQSGYSSPWGDLPRRRV